MLDDGEDTSSRSWGMDSRGKGWWTPDILVMRSSLFSTVYSNNLSNLYCFNKFWFTLHRSLNAIVCSLSWSTRRGWEDYGVLFPICQYARSNTWDRSCSSAAMCARASSWTESQEEKRLKVCESTIRYNTDRTRYQSIWRHIWQKERVNMRFSPLLPILVFLFHFWSLLEQIAPILSRDLFYQYNDQMPSTLRPAG